MRTNSEIAFLIDERIHKSRDRQIMKRKEVDGVTYEALAEEFAMSPRGLKYLVKRNREKIY